MMDRFSLIDADRNRRYLLEKTQHLIGGFGKGVGEPPGRLGSLRTVSFNRSPPTRRSIALLLRHGVTCFPGRSGT